MCKADDLAEMQRGCCVLAAGSTAGIAAGDLRQPARQLSCQRELAVGNPVDERGDGELQTAAGAEVVLLAPGGTSFDEFKDFEARGERFRQLVSEL